ncbi:hypothetical protein A9Q87_06985 [Flavobacteriales bacterium 34_180_T64]|nr:hypothetical protein A9Q87_06985 [Flavobacteriales bacterium 34_180_T64]
MKKNYTLKFLLFCLLALNVQVLFAQNLEDFETDPAGSSSFVNTGLTFNLSSSVGETYNVFEHGYFSGGSSDSCIGCGWNGTSIDQKFIDNTGDTDHNGEDNGSSFTITTAGSVDIAVNSLYLFCSTRAIGVHSGDVTFTGIRNGVIQYFFTKSSGFASPTTFTPNNGFTFIDFATEGSSDYSLVKIDELVIDSTGNLDYMALDTFSWVLGSTLSIDDADSQNTLSVSPNPSTDVLHINGIQNSEHYSIYSVLGKEILQGRVSDNAPIRIKHLDSGIYFIRIGNQLTTRFIKQ